MGHFSFESVCYFEESVVRVNQENDINAPDISLIICKEFIVFELESHENIRTGLEKVISKKEDEIEQLKDALSVPR